MEDTTLALLARWREGDERAAGDLFDRYAGRLVALARSRLSERLAGRLDPEDLVQSACRSFFARTRDGRLDPGRDLWQLLVTITLRKLANGVKHHTRAKRALDRECPLADADPPAAGPGPDEAVALAEEVEAVRRDLGPLDGRVFDLRLDGFDAEEIAAQTRRSVRTVRRVLERVRHRLAGDAAGGRPC